MIKGNDGKLRHPDGKRTIENGKIELSLPEDLPGVKPGQASIPTGREELALRFYWRAPPLGDCRFVRFEMV